MMLVVFDKIATGGSASIKEDKNPPPKQQSIVLNQDAIGLRDATSTAPII